MIKNTYFKAIRKASCDGILPEMGDYWRNHFDGGSRDYSETHVKHDLIDFLTMRSVIRSGKNVQLPSE